MFKGVDPRPARTGRPHLSEAFTHRELILGVQEGVGAWFDGERALELCEKGLGDVLMFESEHVSPFDERANKLVILGQADC